MTFSFVQSEGMVIINQVQLVPNRQIGQLDLIAQPVLPGEGLQIHGLTVTGYEQITPIGLNPTAIDHGTISFGVSGTSLNTHQAAPQDIVMMRYHDTQWNTLPTRFDYKSSDISYFIADTPGFSYFAVAVKPAGSSPLNTSSTSVVSTSHIQGLVVENSSPDVSDRAPIEAEPVLSQTTVIPPAPQSFANSGIPFIVPFNWPHRARACSLCSIRPAMVDTTAESDAVPERPLNAKILV